MDLMPRKRPRPDVFFQGNGHGHPQHGLPLTDLARYKPSLAGDGPDASERESLSTGLGSKGKACLKFFSTSGCPYGEGCHFSHYMPGGLASLGHLQPSHVKVAGRLGSRKELAVPSSFSSLDKGHGSEGFKSRLCKNHDLPEGCRFGDRCHFAHGEKELGKHGGGGSFGGEARNLDRFLPLQGTLDQSESLDGFKTKLCRNFQSSEGCHFGDKCHFAHGEKELRRANGSVNTRNERNEPHPPGLAAAASFGAASTAKISIDASIAGFVIGKGGVNAKSISRSTGARIYVKEHESDKNIRNIEMEGSFDQIKQASTMIRELLFHMDVNLPKQGGVLASHTYKAKLCENFPKGSCTYGDRCHFAHGASELRASPSV